MRFTMRLNTRQILYKFYKIRLEKSNNPIRTYRDLQIFYLRNIKEMKLHEIGSEFNLSGERVRGIAVRKSREFERFLRIYKMEI